MDPIEATEAYAERLRRRAVEILRYDGALRQSVLALLLSLERDIEKAIRRIDPLGVDRVSYQIRRRELLLREVRGLIRNAYREAARFSRSELDELASIEAAWTREAMKSSFGVSIGVRVAPKAVLASLVGNALIEGTPLAEWWSRQADDMIRGFSDQMRLGVAQGETLQQLVQRVRGTRRGGFKDGIMETNRRHAEALTRTAVGSVSNEARFAVYEANADLIEAYVHVSTLDSRTTVQCAARDGLKWDLEKKPIGHDVPFRVPPIHVNCRSLITIVVKGADEIAGQRASAFGPVPANIGFEDWLRNRSSAFQDEVLGPGRAELWRSGRLTLRDLLDFKGDPLSLAELRERF